MFTFAGQALSYGGVATGVDDLEILNDQDYERKKNLNSGSKGAGLADKKTFETYQALKIMDIRPSAFRGNQMKANPEAVSNDIQVNPNQ